MRADVVVAVVAFGLVLLFIVVLSFFGWSRWDVLP